MVRAVLVGCGAMSQAWLEAARATGVEIVGLVDIDVERARGRAAEFGLDAAVVGTDLDAVLAATRPDVVFDVALPAARRGIVETALRHGCPRPDREAARRQPRGRPRDRRAPRGTPTASTR